MIEALILFLAQLTGITRDVDPHLTQIAQERSGAIVCGSDDFYNHTGKPDGVAEILTCFPDSGNIAQQAATNWRNSAVHWGILTNPQYGRIGCGATSRNGTILVACELAPGQLPNTALSPPSYAGILLILAAAIGFQLEAKRVRLARRRLRE